jgi:hypothetical protein
MSTGFAGEAATADNGWAATAQDFAGTGEFEFDAAEVDATKVGNETSFNVEKPGKYHFEVTLAEYRLDTVDKGGHHAAPHVLVALTVIHTVPGQSPEGSRFLVNLFVAGKGGGPREKWQTEQTINLLEGFGLVTRKDGLLIDPENGTTKLNWKTWASRLRGMQVIADVKMSKPDPERTNPQTGKPYDPRPELGYGRGVYQVTDPKVKDVAKNTVALNAWLAATGRWHAAGLATPPATKTVNNVQAGQTVASAPTQTAPASVPAAAQAPATAPSFDDL